MRIYCLIISFLIAEFSLAQSDQENHQKYWYYKSRLNNDFIKVGLDSGESIPFNTRGRWATSFAVENVEMGSGDATSILGNYIALLATEIHLLRANGQPTDKTRHELFCALNAINRLDVEAEDIWQIGSGRLNGFFIRDDISKAFLRKPENFAHFNYFDAGVDNHQESRGFMSRMECGANKVASDLTQHFDHPTHDISMSQDQVYNLLFGLMFVTRFVALSDTDGNSSFGFGSGERRLVIEARNISNRIIGFVRNSVDLNGNSCNEDISTGWSIRNPTTCEKVLRGSDAHIYAYPLAEIECLINQPVWGEINRVQGIPYACAGHSGGYHNFYSAYFAYYLWNNTAKTSIFLPSSSHFASSTRAFNAQLTSLCNCVWGTPDELLLNSIVRPLNSVRVLNNLSVGLDWAWNLRGSIVSSLLPGFLFNTSASTISKISYVNGNGSQSNRLGDPGSPFDHAPLVRKILHGGRYIANNRYTFKYLLDIAPCAGIYNLNHMNYPHYEWSSDSRIDSPDRRGWYAGNRRSKNPFSPNEWRPSSAEYNGIDYMLYHNLWYVHQLQEGRGSDIEDMSDRRIEGIGFGSSMSAFESIEVRNAALTNKDSMYLRSGKTIYLGPGTEITGSNNIRLYIDRVECATETGQFSTSTPPKERKFPKAKSKGEVIQPILTDEDFKIVPTVTDAKCRVFFDLQPNESGFLRVLDLTGNCVISLEMLKVEDSGLTIDLSGISSGVYIVELLRTTGDFRRKKLIKL